MNKKLFLGLVGGLLFLGMGLIFASTDDIKPYESITQFRGGEIESARDLGIDKDIFVQERNQLREAHREERMEAKRERMEAAGCFSSEEIEERMQTRRGRFAK